MPETSPETLTRTDYDRLEHLGMAGAVTAVADTTAVDRWREMFPDWRARHWVYRDTGGVLRLTPVNVARRTPDRAAA
ncbi:hypothetical protein [Nocardia carnea]|uniref:hypothetical protein n=1 Tax=Nocardia carnea TaxID=37328 RepID=UPI002457DBB6|nr:hypothetical protein [Nocardia carnea]